MRAQEQVRATVQVISELFGPNSTIYGYAIYNLGCFYARNGETAQAIAAVGEALPLTNFASEPTTLPPLEHRLGSLECRMFQLTLTLHGGSRPMGSQANRLRG